MPSNPREALYAERVTAGSRALGARLPEVSPEAGQFNIFRVADLMRDYGH